MDWVGLSMPSEPLADLISNDANRRASLFKRNKLGLANGLKTMLCRSAPYDKLLAKHLLCSLCEFPPAFLLHGYPGNDPLSEVHARLARTAASCRPCQSYRGPHIQPCHRTADGA